MAHFDREYDAVSDRVGLDDDRPQASPGIRQEVEGGGVCVVDVWESQEGPRPLPSTNR